MTNNIINYLEAVKDLYPFGVPKRFLMPQPQVEAVSLILIGSPLTEQGRQLLDAALIKGLKLVKSQYRILTSSELQDQNLKEIVTSENVSCLVFFGDLGDPSMGTILKGATFPEGEWFNLYGKRAIRTISPDQVYKDPSLKRRYWEQLQKILPVLGKQ